MPPLPDIHVFVSMMKEEWRLHQSFIGRMGSGLFPLFIFTLTAFLAVFSRYILGNMTLERGMLVIHAASIVYGVFVGGLGNMGEQVMTRRLGQVSMLLQLPQLYPVSFKRVMAIFYVKDALFYVLYTFLPLTAGLMASSPDWAMISYPSKAMKVSPMATTMLSGPLGMNPVVKRVCQASVRNMARNPKRANRPRMTILVMVTMLPTVPVSEAPR